MTGVIEGPPNFAAKFAVILDAPLTLAVGEDIDREFDFRLDRVVREMPTIISFLLVRADSLQLQVTMNRLGFGRDYSPGPERSVHEILGPAARDGVNRLTLRVQRGSCRISDLIVWYHAFVD